jgi:Tfp pilus assembly protein PilO
MRRGLLFGILGLLVITAAWWFLFMAPKSGEISDFNEERDAALIEQRTLEARRDELAALAAREGEFLLGISEVQASIPVMPDGAALIEDINRIATESDIELLTLSPGLPTPSTIPGLFEIQLQMSFEAPYFKVLAFLFALEEQERLVRVDQIAITSRVLDDGTNLLSTSLTGSAFSQTDLAGSPPAEVTP